MAVPHNGSPYITIYSTGFTYTPIKFADLRYTISSDNEISTLVAWIEKEKNNELDLQFAVSLGESEETYSEIETKVYPVNQTHEEHQLILNPETPVKQVTLRITATKDNPEAVAKIDKITGAVD